MYHVAGLTSIDGPGDRPDEAHRREWFGSRRVTHVVSRRGRIIGGAGRGAPPDPFGVLGPHVEPGGVVIRACVPTAERDLRDAEAASAPVAMKRRHPAGIFEATIPGRRRRFPTTGCASRTTAVRPSDIDDPYRYGRVLTDYDLYLFGEGKHTRIYDKLGAHLDDASAAPTGVHFAVWAPNAARVSVVGDFNAWDGRVHPMRTLGPSGVWEIFIPGVGRGRALQVRAPSTLHGEMLLKSDPFGFAFEVPPLTASIVARPDYAWQRRRLDGRARRRAALVRPADGHLRGPPRFVGARAGGGRSLPDLRASWRTRLIPYVKEMGYTHIELLPVMEHPFSGLVGLPGHRLLRADQPLRHAARVQGVRRRLPPGRHRRDPRLGARPFPEGRARPGALRRHGALRARRPAAGRASRLGHADLQLRPQRGAQLPARQRALLAATSTTSTACASTPSPRCSTWITRATDGEWVPNKFGGRENLEAIEFLRELNTLTHGEQPGSITVAEESTALPSREPPDLSRRPRFHLQVEHGLDERHPRIRQDRIRSTAATITGT